MPTDNPEDLGLALFLMRTVRGWSQTEMARAAGITSSMLSEFERGRRNPSQKSLERLTKAAGVPLSALHEVLPALRSLREAVESGVVERRPYQDIIAAQVGTVTDNLLRASLELVFRGHLAKREIPPPRPEEREEAPELWNRLRSFAPQDQILLLEEAEEYRKWALCELICHESAEAARESPERAVELSRLALRIAELVPGEEAWRSRLQGYAWAHVGNARRASGDLAGAEEALLRAGLLWRAGASAEPGLLDEARITELEALSE